MSIILMKSSCIIGQKHFPFCQSHHFKSQNTSFTDRLHMVKAHISGSIFNRMTIIITFNINIQVHLTLFNIRTGIQRAQPQIDHIVPLFYNTGFQLSIRVNSTSHDNFGLIKLSLYFSSQELNGHRVTSLIRGLLLSHGTTPSFRFIGSSIGDIPLMRKMKIVRCGAGNGETEAVNMFGLFCYCADVVKESVETRGSSKLGSHVVG